MFAPRVAMQAAPHVGHFSQAALKASASSLIFWGATGIVGGLFFLEKVPFIRQDVFANLPLVGRLYVTPTEESS
ncbi:hypothetical protein IWQ60_002119 [Tieghemiomyces parasiticus]|uniref:Uncharacterized protein n=1 Tax=Tieghemiomyces parasiticus TaxID=78921 RepID=A0A9W8AI01_9FUNG|nr:hypothetical protein IWQ60_002119 [Tieghemiomyces parasiticus]